VVSFLTVLSHVVLFAPRTDLHADERRALLDAFERAVRTIPTVRAVRVGRRKTHDAAYEQQTASGIEYMVIIDFENLAGLQAYLDHPAHHELGARFNQSIGAAVIYDFEVGSIEDLQRLV